MNTFSTRIPSASYTVGLLLASPKDLSKLVVEEEYIHAHGFPLQLTSHTEAVHTPSKVELDIRLYTFKTDTSSMDLTYLMDTLGNSQLTNDLKTRFLTNPIPAYGIIALLPEERKTLPSYKEEDMLSFAYRKQIHMGFTKNSFEPNFLVLDDQKGPKGYFKYNWSQQLFRYNVYKLNKLTSS